MFLLLASFLSACLPFTSFIFLHHFSLYLCILSESFFNFKSVIKTQERGACDFAFLGCFFFFFMNFAFLSEFRLSLSLSEFNPRFQISDFQI